MKQFTAVAAIALGCSFAIPASAQGALPEPANKVIDYHKDIAPIFAEHCSKCHGDAKQKSDYRLDSRDTAISSGTAGGAIKVGNSAESLLVAVITGTAEFFDIMPPKGDPLTPEQIGLIRAWIDQGAIWEGSAAAPKVEIRHDKEPFPGLGEQWFVEATSQQGPLATWELSAEKGPEGESCVALVSPNHENPGTFNLLWDNNARFEDGRLEVRLKAISGEEDRGGGLLWRAKDSGNYYVARYNPLEKNVALYQVTDGKREQLAGAEIAKPADAWTTLAVEHRGNHIKVSLDGRVLIEVESEAHGAAGGIGLWTKADAATLFTRPVVQSN